ncbi:TonB-dependent siderophore receptor [Acinetobacter baumannii]|uniref:TonB-dependent siderophore receptor n=1 Tax=Acinetobacter baumannii TaxID=470 RepID=UPI0035C678BA
MSKRIIQSVLSVSVLASMMSMAFAAQNEQEQAEQTLEKPAEPVKLETIFVTAEEQVKQSLGVSVITKEDLEKLPVRNDISDYVRRMPGVNLTGNSATGQRGNNRQIDIRGMGPENTLILVDGKPINSRNSVRYGWKGERDTRGDSNWVPAEAIESIEVLRGPAAARYGSGAAGGVVNIITKKVTNETHGSVEFYTSQPEDSKEGSSNRVGFNVSGPLIKDVLSYRLYGNYNKTEADDVDINKSIGSTAAGREGVKNKDISGRLAWQATDQQTVLLDISSSKQGNIYSGDSQLNANAEADAILSQLIGKETNTMYRDSYALTHEGDWSWGKSKLVAQYDKTHNKRLPEGLAGSVEGKINNLDDKATSRLETLRFNGEANISFEYYLPQVLTVGTEWVEDRFKDNVSTTQGKDSSGSGYGDQLAKGDRSKMESRIASAYIEDNLKVTDSTDVVLGLRFDDHSKSGSNWSPSLNITQKLNDYFTLKGGVAKAYKAPNMYQNAEGYLLSTNGNGCPANIESRCLLQGNGDLKPETSVNKELGIQFQKDIVNASLTWFRNDYKDKIVAGTHVVGTVDGSSTNANTGAVTNTKWNILRWENTPKALIQGFEGSLGLDFGDIRWTNNFTYMMDSKDKQTGNPLSLVPIYTINSIFDYDITDQLDVNFVFTQYGRQKSRQFAENRLESGIGSGGANSALKPSTVKSYSTAGINVGYKFSDQISTRVGVSNLFDKQILRDSNSISQTYNEPGRAYYASLKYSF